MCVFHCATQLMLSAGMIYMCEWTPWRQRWRWRWRGSQMGKEQWKAHVSGYRRCIFAVYFVPGNWTRGMEGLRLGGSKGGGILKCFSTTFFSFCSISFSHHKSNFPLFNLDFLLWLHCPRNCVYLTTILRHAVKLLAVLLWGRNHHSVCGLLCLGQHSYNLLYFIFIFAVSTSITIQARISS